MGESVYLAGEVDQELAYRWNRLTTSDNTSQQRPTRAAWKTTKGRSGRQIFFNAHVF
jgi:hypothetical protein